MQAQFNQARPTLLAVMSSLVLAACGSSSNSPRAVPVVPALNDSGSPVTGVLTARFDPSTGVIPLPNNLLLSGTRDLTLNPPVANPNNFGDPLVAVSALDGWSTVAPWSLSFNQSPDPATLRAGQTIRVFEVTLTGPGGGVTGVTRELTSPAEFVVAQASSDTTGRTVAIVPTSPLKELTSYLAVVTDGVRDRLGNDATPDSTYFLTKRPTALCANGVSLEPLLPAASTCALEPLRLLTNSHLAAARTRGINPNDVVVSWVMTTQSIRPVLLGARAITRPATVRFSATGLTTAAAGLPPIADIYVGFIDVPYYLEAPSAANPTAPLTTFWRAAPNGYVAPFNRLGLDPTSTNLTFANPIPVLRSTQRIPVLMTVPNAASGRTKPASGWPITIFQHGVTRNRTDGLAISATLASQGFAMVAIDIPLHGVSPGNSNFAATRGFYVNPANPLMAPLHAAGVRERTFDVDYVNNSTGAAGPDGIPESSGSYTINLASLLTVRDNNRQAIVDLLTLSASIPRMDADADGSGDFDVNRVSFVAQSLGSIVGLPFLALDANVKTALLSVPGGGLPYFLNASPAFGPRIQAGLAAVGLRPGTPDYDRFLGAAQQVTDSADPINFTPINLGPAAAARSIILHEVVGNGTTELPDQVIPNAVAGAPLGGTEPLIRALGLSAITRTTQSATGVRGVVRFTKGEHGSLLSPARSLGTPNPVGHLDVLTEMQTQMASYLASGGAAVVVTNTGVIRTQ